MPHMRLKTPGIGYEEMPLHLDEDGFLVNTNVWSSETARILAEVDGIGYLGSAHWAVINFLREKYFEYGGLPSISRLCRSLSLGRSGVHELFGSCTAAWRVAGLPNPGEEAKSYMK